MSRYFQHEKLEVYKLSVSVTRRVLKLNFPKGFSALKDQAFRAVTSIPLNIAEGNGRNGAARKNHFEIARGSAAEVCAILDCVELKGADGVQEDLRAIGAMLRTLAK